MPGNNLFIKFPKYYTIFMEQSQLNLEMTDIVIRKPEMRKNTSTSPETLPSQI